MIEGYTPVLSYDHAYCYHVSIVNEQNKIEQYWEVLDGRLYDN